MVTRLQQLLVRAEHDARTPGFADLVAARLAMGSQLHGDRWRSLGVERLLAELMEEAADIGGWGVLAHQAVDLDDRLLRADRAEIQAAIELVIAAGAVAAARIRRAEAKVAAAR